MFDSKNLQDLFTALGKLSANSNHPLNGTAQTLAKLYLGYLETKKDNPSTHHRNIPYMLKNLKGTLDIDNAVIDAICDDLLQKQGAQHAHLLHEDEDDDFVEFLRTQYGDAFAIKQSLTAVNQVPSTLKTGFDQAKPALHQEFAMKTAEVDIYETTVDNLNNLFSEDPLVVQSSLQNIAQSPAFYLSLVSEQKELNRIYDIIKDTTQSTSLRLLAVCTLINLGPFFFGNSYFIDDNLLKEALFTLNDVCKNKLFISTIFHALSFCHPKHLTHNEISDLIDLVILAETPFEQRYYCIRCILSVLHPTGQPQQASRCLSALLDVLTVEHPTMLSPRESSYFKLTCLIIGQYFMSQTQVQTNQCTSQHVTQMINIASAPNTHPIADSRVDEMVKFAILQTLKALSTGKAIIKSTDLLKLVHFLPHITAKHLPILIQILQLQTQYSNVPIMLSQTGSIEKLLSNIQIDIDTEQSAITVISSLSILFWTAQYYHPILKQCVEQNVYQQTLLFYQKLLNTNFQIEDDYIELLPRLLTPFNPHIVFNSQLVEWVTVQLLPKLKHVSMKNHILSFFIQSIQSDQALIKPFIETILSTIVSWPSSDDSNLVHIFALINNLLELATPENIGYFTRRLHGYNWIKTHLSSQNVELIKSALSIINKLQNEPEIMEDLLSNGKMVSVLDKLSQSKNPHIQSRAQQLFIQRDLKCAQDYKDEGKFYEALVLYKNILRRQYTSTHAQCAAHAGCAKIYHAWQNNNQKRGRHYTNAIKHYQDLLTLDPNAVDENNNKITHVLAELQKNHYAYLESSRAHSQAPSIFRRTTATPNTIIIPQLSGNNEFDEANRRGEDVAAEGDQTHHCIFV